MARCNPYWLLTVNVALFVWMGLHANYAATFEFPEVMTNQSCCRGEYLPSGDCCPRRITNVRGHWQCYWHDRDWTAVSGVYSDVKRYRWFVFVALFGAAFVPYHAPFVFSAHIENEEERFNEIMGGVCAIFGLFIVPWLILFLYANIILGYSRTIECKHPETSEYLMLYYHAPYDFWMLVLGAWGVPAIVGAVIALVLVGAGLALVGMGLFGLLMICLGIDAEPAPPPKLTHDTVSMAPTERSLDWDYYKRGHSEKGEVPGVTDV